MKDLTGSFQAAYTMMGCITIASAGFYSLEPVVRRLQQRRVEQTQHEVLKTENSIYKPTTTQ